MVAVDVVDDDRHGSIFPFALENNLVLPESGYTPALLLAEYFEHFGVRAQGLPVLVLVWIFSLRFFARCHRIGQTKDVQVFHYIMDSFDEENSLITMDKYIDLVQEDKRIIIGDVIPQ